MDRMNPVLVVSPHLDDAVISAGQFLAGRPGAVVVTMLAGEPNPPVIREWDNMSGFATSQEALRARWAEDERALAVVKATAVHLGFLDGQYEPAARADLANALVEQVEHFQPEFVVGPLGVHHPDHERVRDAVLAANLDMAVWLYADLPYSVDRPQEAEAALEAIESRGYALELGLIGTGPLGAKIEALGCYPSQMQHYSINTMIGAERFWRVNRVS
jgi:LmbE family N-acetylglucosaminyl deacetylase